MTHRRKASAIENINNPIAMTDAKTLRLLSVPRTEIPA
jgi:hypothetical protein